MAEIINDQPPPPPPPTNPPAPFNAKDFVVQKGYMLDSMSKPSGSGSLAVTGKSLCSRSLTGENISDLESESESESEFLILGPSLPRTPINVPSLEPELSPSLSLSPSSTPESEPISVPGPSRPSVLQESAPPAPTLVYQRRSKPDLLQKQIQSPEPEVSTENDSSSDDCAISDTCDTNPVDLPIALRKDKRSCPSLYRHPISQYVSTKHLSTQYQNFIAAVNSVKIPSSVEEALQNRNWVQAMDEEMRALEKNASVKPKFCDGDNDGNLHVKCLASDVKESVFGDDFEFEDDDDILLSTRISQIASLGTCSGKRRL
ncbi:hypothetical protein KIW84_057619 [Lathyrus oleraceus]|uniref:Uncharacterized protein n=1 Tax=Pisum sativum TaxID=3888 RepID=A0A9D5AIG1_PEA|nr:hypothetical protein KIW84_057619 [Pisum sativum]